MTSTVAPIEPTFRRTLVREVPPSAWSDAPVLVVIACDPSYLGHAIALVRSMEAFSGPTHVLVHLVNSESEHIARLKRVSTELRDVTLLISAEEALIPKKDLRTYYACARFLRIAELLGLPGVRVPMLALDADALAVGPLTLDFSDKAEADVCLRRRDQGTEVVPDHLRVAAGAVWVRPSKAGRTFMQAVANDLVDAFQEGEGAWFLDQLVLLRHVEAATGGAAVRNLKSKFSDWSMMDDAVFWTGKGNRKYLDVRYLLLRESLDEDPARRLAARALSAQMDSLVPPGERTTVMQRVRRVLSRARKPRVAIFLPRLDLPWKLSGLKENGAPPVQSADVIELRLWWKRFTMELARMLDEHGAEPTLLELPAWEITPQRVDMADADLAFVPHRCSLDFGRTVTTTRFYMQEYFQSVFVVDPDGWSAASSVYPVQTDTLPPAVLGAWDEYRSAFQAGTLSSKFSQARPASRDMLVEGRQLPSVPYVFYPLQVPHDQSIRYFSDVDQDAALDAVTALARATGLTLVLKEHPANRASMRTYRERYAGAATWWTDANLHDVIRHAEGVVTINSGVGFEALLAGKPVVCLGRAEYDAAATKSTSQSLQEAWARATAEPEDTRLRRYGRFVDWFLGRHAVDLSRPATGRYVLDRLVRGALEEAMAKRSEP